MPAGVTVMSAVAPAATVPLAGSIVYAAAFVFAAVNENAPVPPFVRVIFWGAAAAPPHGFFPKSSALVETVTVPLTPSPLSESDDALVPQMAPVVLIAEVADAEPVDAGVKLAVRFANVPPAVTVPVAGATAKSALVGAPNVTWTSALPVFFSVSGVVDVFPTLC